MLENITQGYFFTRLTFRVLALLLYFGMLLLYFYFHVSVLSWARMPHLLNAGEISQGVEINSQNII